MTDQVWFVVSPQNPLKKAHSLLNEYDRLNLIHLAIDEDDRFKVSDVEFKLPKPSYTIDTLTYLQEKHPKYTFSLIMGSDSFQNLTRWKNYELLVKNYPFIIYEREGFPVEDTLGAQCTFVKAPLLNISATDIRTMIKEGMSLKYVVPEKVKEEIEKNGYYK
ncbi:nicotinate-nucleotide adenylyltransferase [Filimonas lacunae]|nr:nicotinate-nucleotide adenylyltransferase [Filimonas lacunae]